MDHDHLRALDGVACPFCGSRDTELIALFGMQMMTSQYYCRHCRTAFEAVKWDVPRNNPPEKDQPHSP